MAGEWTDLLMWDHVAVTYRRSGTLVPEDIAHAKMTFNHVMNHMYASHIKKTGLDMHPKLSVHPGGVEYCVWAYPTPSPRTFPQDLFAGTRLVIAAWHNSKLRELVYDGGRLTKTTYEFL